MKIFQKVRKSMVLLKLCKTRHKRRTILIPAGQQFINYINYIFLKNIKLVQAYKCFSFSDAL